jgi:DNA-binding MarR family transcriptional regulator
MDSERANALNTAIRLIAIRHRVWAAAHLASIGLHPGQEVMLLELAASGPRSQVIIAEELGCEAPTVTIMAKKLEAAGLIARTPSPVDARINLVDLTDKGRALIPQLNDAWLALAEDTVAGLKDTGVTELIATLEDLVQSLYGRSPTPKAT